MRLDAVPLPWQRSSAPLAAVLATGPAPVAALLCPLLLLPVAALAASAHGLVLLLAGAVTIEQFRYRVGEREAPHVADPLLSRVAPGTCLYPGDVLSARARLLGPAGACATGTLVHWTPLARASRALVASLVVYFASGSQRR